MPSPIAPASDMRPLRIALIDNYDSYTHNLAHLIAAPNANTLPTVISSDAYPSLHQLSHAHPPFDAFILSPGPGNPTNESDFPPLQRDILSSSFPVFAVCLGHQALSHMHGASIQQLSPIPAHGIISTITLAPSSQRCPLFHSMPTTFSAVRYHSLVAVPPASKPFALIPTAWTTHSHLDKHGPPILMAVAHPDAPHFGVQFHPESVSSEKGSLLAANFVHLAARLRAAHSAPRPLVSTNLTSSLPLPLLRELQSQPTFSTLFSVLRPHNNLPPFHVFSKFFAHRQGAFWLDSSNADTHAARLSSCSSPASIIDTPLQTPSNPLNHIPTHVHQPNSRFSIMGACMGPLSEIVTYDVDRRTVTVRTQCQSPVPKVTHLNISIFDYLQAQLRLRRATVPPQLPCEMNGGYVGYIGYEAKRDVHGVRHNRHSSHMPDAWLVFADRLFIFDHRKGDIYLVALVNNQNHHQRQQALQWFDDTEKELISVKREDTGPVTDAPAHVASGRQSGNQTRNNIRPLTFVPERSHGEYLSDIDACLRAIKTGESYEVCLTNRIRACINGGQKMDALQFYGALRTMNSAPYSAFLRISEEDVVCCTSPERFLRIGADGQVQSKPIKGTRGRGRSFEEDEMLRRELQNSSKDRSENLMIVDLVRNDLSRTCTVGSVKVPRLMHVESYATVHQLVSDVIGVLGPEYSGIDCLRAAYPMGSMTGAPKNRTMEIIDNLEQSPRGVYSGTIGFLSVSGAADLNVVIRTAIVEGTTVTIGVGGAIVAMSDAEEEYAETILKGTAIMQAVAKHVTGDSEAFAVDHDHEHAILQPVCGPRKNVQ